LITLIALPILSLYVYIFIHFGPEIWAHVISSSGGLAEVEYRHWLKAVNITTVPSRVHQPLDPVPIMQKGTNILQYFYFCFHNAGMMEFNRFQSGVQSSQGT
jgi:hypothetical protein